MGDDRSLRQHEARVGLVNELPVGRQRVRRKAACDLAAVEHLVWEVVLGARAEYAFEDPVAALDRTRHVEELLSGLVLELAPELVRAPEQGHVVRVLEVREADDPREAVGRALVVEDVEALEPEHALSAAGEVVERRASHPADSDDDDVVPLHEAILRAA